MELVKHDTIRFREALLRRNKTATLSVRFVKKVVGVVSAQSAEIRGPHGREWVVCFLGAASPLPHQLGIWGAL